jgi:Fe-S-cluster containining protein
VGREKWTHLMERAKRIAERFNREAEALAKDRALQQQMTAEQRLYVGYETGEASAAAEILSEERTTEQVRELGEHLHHFTQGEIDTLIANTSPADRPACRAGCAFCCASPVEIRAPEAIYIALRLREERSSAELDALIERLRPRVAERRGWSCDERWLKRRMCVFLQDDWRCGIYAFRPLNCRGWTSKSRDDCASESDVRPYMFVQLAAHAVGNGLTRATAAMELESNAYEFEAAILRALETPRCCRTVGTRRADISWLRSAFDVRRSGPRNDGNATAGVGPDETFHIPSDFVVECVTAQRR